MFRTTEYERRRRTRYHANNNVLDFAEHSCTRYLHIKPMSFVVRKPKMFAIIFPAETKKPVKPMFDMMMIISVELGKEGNLDRF